MGARENGSTNAETARDRSSNGQSSLRDLVGRLMDLAAASSMRTGGDWALASGALSVMFGLRLLCCCRSRRLLLLVHLERCCPRPPICLPHESRAGRIEELRPTVFRAVTSTVDRQRWIMSCAIRLDSGFALNAARRRQKPYSDSGRCLARQAVWHTCCSSHTLSSFRRRLVVDILSCLQVHSLLNI